MIEVFWGVIGGGPQVSLAHQRPAGFIWPFFDNDKPYESITAAFSRCNDKYRELEPAALVD